MPNSYGLEKEKLPIVIGVITGETSISRCFALYEGKFRVKETLWQGQLCQGCFKRWVYWALLSVRECWVYFFWGFFNGALKIFYLTIYLLNHIIIWSSEVHIHTHAHEHNPLCFPLSFSWNRSITWFWLGRTSKGNIVQPPAISGDIFS